MHLKALLTAGAATASLLAGAAGTALIGHAASVPAKHHTTVRHVSTPNHQGTYRKGSTGTHRHHGGTISGKNGVHHHTKKTPPKSTPTPTPHM
jgi:hypothetical protein